MSRRTAIELAVGLVAVAAIVVVATRGTDADSAEPTAQGGAAEKGERAQNREANGGAGASAKSKAGNSSTETQSEAAATQERVSTSQFSGDTVLDIFGLRGHVRVEDEGRTVIVVIGRKHACAAVPADEQRIRDYLIENVPAVRKVVVTVSGTGQSLSAYVRANCKQTKFPGGPGRTVFRQTGEGFDSPKKFTIRRKKWAIDYQAMGDSLFMLISDGKKILVPGIAQKKRGVGTQRYKGKGRYKVEIRGSGFWKVRIREGV